MLRFLMSQNSKPNLIAGTEIEYWQILGKVKIVRAK